LTFNVAVEWSTLLLCIWDIQGSYDVLETACSDYGFSGLSPGPSCRYEGTTLNYKLSLPSISCAVYCSH